MQGTPSYSRGFRNWIPKRKKFQVEYSRGTLSLHGALAPLTGLESGNFGVNKLFVFAFSPLQHFGCLGDQSKKPWALGIRYALHTHPYPTPIKTATLLTKTASDASAPAGFT